MATFKLELTGDEAVALRQIMDAATIRGKDARVVSSILDKTDAAADAFNEDTKKEEQSSSPPDTPKTESPRLDGAEGGEVS